MSTDTAGPALAAGTITERVAAGAAALDEREPGWHERIDLARLATSSCRRCVLGQVFGRFITGREALGTDGAELGDRETIAFGFAVTGDEKAADKPDAREYPLLDAEWKRVIGARQENLTEPRSATP